MINEFRFWVRFLTETSVGYWSLFLIIVISLATGAHHLSGLMTPLLEIIVIPEYIKTVLSILKWSMFIGIISIVPYTRGWRRFKKRNSRILK